jgi:hypothetical protein
MADVTLTGTYFVVPYTTGCKFAIAALDDGDKADALFQNGRLTAPAQVAVREIHNRYDVDLDRLLDKHEFIVMIEELTGKALVWFLIRCPCPDSPFSLTPSSNKHSRQLTIEMVRSPPTAL